MSMNSARTIKVEGRSAVRSLLFLEDGKHFLSGGEDGMIRKWCIEDGREVGEAIKGSERVRALALSADRKWIVSGEFKLANVWNRNTWQKVLSIREHTLEVEAVDISSDSTRFATGAMDKRAFIWDISTGRRLVGPLEHDSGVVAVKFSPDGDHIATATWYRELLRIYSARTGELIKTISLGVKTRGLGTIAWSSDSQRIFASAFNTISHIYVDTGSFISKWTIPGDTNIGISTNPGYGSLAVPNNGRFIASFAGCSLSLWDPSTRERFGPVFDHPGQLQYSIALSLDNNYLATGGENGMITVRNLNDIIPIPYLVQRPRNAIGEFGTSLSLRLKIEAVEAFRGAFRTLDSRLDDLVGTTMQPNDRGEATPLLVSDGNYRIKSNIAKVYLTCPQGAADMVVVQQLDLSDDSQKWSVYRVEDGTYNIVGNRGSFNAPLGTRNGNELVCVSDGSRTTWTIEPRGNAYVIGNAVNATAIHLTPRPQLVLAFIRDNSQNQRWVLERVDNQNIPERGSGKHMLHEALSDEITVVGKEEERIG